MVCTCRSPRSEWQSADTGFACRPYKSGSRANRVSLARQELSGGENMLWCDVAIRTCRFAQCHQQSLGRKGVPDNQSCIGSFEAHANTCSSVCKRNSDTPCTPATRHVAGPAGQWPQSHPSSLHGGSEPVPMRPHVRARARTTLGEIGTLWHSGHRTLWTLWTLDRETL